MAAILVLFCSCPFSSIPKGHTPVLLCLSSVYWATIKHIKWLGEYGYGQFKHQIALTIFHKKFGPVKVWAVKTPKAYGHICCPTPGKSSTTKLVS